MPSTSLQTSTQKSIQNCYLPLKLKGFTLLELMITIGIAGILGTMTLPPIIEWVQLKKDQQNIQQISNILKSARQTAMATKTPEILSFTPANYNGTQMPLTINQTGNVNRTHNLSSEIDVILMTQGPIASGTPIGQIRFNGFGMAQAPATGGWQNNQLRVQLRNYGIFVARQGVIEVCSRTTQHVTPSTPICR